MTQINYYTKEYFLKECDGFRQFNNSKSKVLPKRLKKIKSLASVQPGDRVLDFGCGRGELALHFGKDKIHVIGIDTSEPAIKICNQTLKHWKKDIREIDQFVTFLRGELHQQNLPDNHFNLAILSDLIEHLTPETVTSALKEIKRLLKPNGRLLLHTSPNKYYIPYTGRLISLIHRILKLSGKTDNSTETIPWNIRTVLPPGLQKNVHVNEQSKSSLKRSLKKCGLKHIKIWFELNPHYMDKLFKNNKGFAIMNTLRKILPIKHLFYADLFCTARK